MARFEILDSNAAPLGEGPAAGDMLFELGMMYSVGRDVPVDLVSAHKWFNLAAMKGNADAIRLRREIASQMSDVEIATAQRAARDWLRGNAESSGAGDRGLTASRPACAIGLSLSFAQRLADPELVHAGECVGRFGFEGVPAIEIGQARVLESAATNFCKAAGSRLKPANCKSFAARNALISGSVIRCSCT